MHVKLLVRNMAGQDSDPIIKTYLREIMETPLLTPQEEIELAARIKRGDRKDKYSSRLIPRRMELYNSSE